MDMVLVVGGAGFIGSNLVDRLMSENKYVKVLDDFSNGKKENLSRWLGDDRFELIKGDMRDRDVVKKALENVNALFLEAAKVSIPQSIDNPYLFFDVNVMGTIVVLEEARKADIEKIVVASSSSVYGDTPTLPKVEEMSTNPISPYGVSKLAQERLSMVFSSTYGMDISALRYFNVYGPRQRGGNYAGVIQIFISRALESKPILIDGDGQQTRDFTYIDDVVTANILAANSKKAKGRVYNVGGGHQISINHLADTIISLSKSASSKRCGHPRPGDIRDSLAGLKRINAELGYAPSWDIERGLASTIAWFQKNTSKK